MDIISKLYLIWLLVILPMLLLTLMYKSYKAIVNYRRMTLINSLCRGDKIQFYYSSNGSVYLAKGFVLKVRHSLSQVDLIDNLDSTVIIPISFDNIIRKIKN